MSNKLFSLFESLVCLNEDVSETRTEVVSPASPPRPLQSSSSSPVNTDHCVCLHFCERVLISFLSPKWMIIGVNLVFAEFKHWQGLMSFECVHFST